MVEAVTRQYRLFKFQWTFCELGASEEANFVSWKDYLYILLHGGRGSGKSNAGALRMLRYLKVWGPGWKEANRDPLFGIVTAPVYATLDDATLPAILRILRRVGLENGLDYRYVADRSELSFPCFGDAKVILRSTEHPERGHGPDSAFLWMDEARFSTWEAFSSFVPTLRQPGYPHQCWLTTTPAGKTHWTYRFFFDREFQRNLKELAEEQRPSFEVIHARTLDNLVTGAAQYAQLVAMYGLDSPLARQELEGSFVVLEGLVYSGWNPDVHMVPRETWPSQVFKYVIAGMDFGWRHKTGILVIGLDAERRQYLLEEYYKDHVDPEILIRESVRLERQYKMEAIACDPSRPDLIALLRRAGLPAVKANNRVGRITDPSVGIGLCATQLTKRDAEGRPYFYVDPGCVNFKEEIEGFIFVEPKRDGTFSEMPRAEKDDLMAAFRYAEMYIERRGLNALGDFSYSGNLLATRRV